MDGRWHFNLAPYMWMTGIKGDLSVANLPSVPVEAGFSDIWNNFDMGALGHFDARKNRVGMSLDFVYTSLGAPVARSAPVIGSLALEAHVKQLITEGTAFYRVASGGRADNPAHLDVLAGARYYGTRTRLEATTGAGAEYDSQSQDISWVDALAGLKFRAPLGSRFALLGRADIAGFGSRSRGTSRATWASSRRGTGRLAPAGATWTSTTRRRTLSRRSGSDSPTAGRAPGSPTPGSPVSVKPSAAVLVYRYQARTPGAIDGGHMKRIVAGCAVIGLGLALEASHAGAQDLQQKVAAAKQAAAQNQQALAGYTWIEKTEVAMKGEVKSTKLQSCRYGPDGKVQKTPLSEPAPPAEPSAVEAAGAAV